MKSFDSLYSRLLTPILDSILSDPYIGGVFKVNNDRYFADTVARITGIDVRIGISSLNNNFPQLARVGVTGEKREFKVTAGATEPGTESGRTLANLKAKGEFLERISSFLPLDLVSKNDFDRSKTAEAAPASVYARKLFSYGYQKVDSALVYYGLFGRRKDMTFAEVRCQPTTNGGAGHFEYPTAALSGLLELIQRDAFLVHWLTGTAPQKIDVDRYLAENAERARDDAAFAELRTLISDLRKYNLAYYFLNITSDIAVPTVCCVLVSESPTGKRMALGASAGFDTDKVLLSSATEAIGGLSHVYFKEVFDLEDDYLPFTSKKIGRDERTCIYMNDRNYEKFAFFLENDDEGVSVSTWSTLPDWHGEQTDVKSGLNYLKKIFSQRQKQNENYEVLVYEIKNKLLKAFDYKIVRVICRGLYPLYLNEQYADPHHPRLKEFAVHKGLGRVEITTWPHPFP